MDNRMTKQNNNRTHYDKTENNKTYQDVSEEYRKHVKKKKLNKNDEKDFFGNQSEPLCRYSHEQHLTTYIKLIQSRSGRIEECQERTLGILMLHS